MALFTVEELIKDAYRDGIGNDADAIPNDMIDLGVYYYNKCGKKIYDQFLWDESKKDVFEIDSVDGIITFDGDDDIDIILAIRPKNTNSSSDINPAIWPEDIANAFINGRDVSSLRFTYLAPDSSDNRRVKVATSDNIDTYYVYAKTRFTRATVESSYDSENPSATPTDYRVLKWPVSHVSEGVAEYMADRYREYIDEDLTREWERTIAIEIDKVRKQQATGNQIVPANPMFANIGSNYAWTQSTLRTV